MGHSGGLNHLAVASAPPPRPAAALQGCARVPRTLLSRGAEGPGPAGGPLDMSP
jgi:hypothetical protein